MVLPPKLPTLPTTHIMTPSADDATLATTNRSSRAPPLATMFRAHVGFPELRSEPIMTASTAWSDVACALPETILRIEQLNTFATVTDEVRPRAANTREGTTASSG